MQRTIQQFQDSPMEYFYNFEPTITSNADQKMGSSKTYGDAIAENFISRDLKIEMIPLARNKIRVRIENIADSYDDTHTSINFNVKDFAEALYLFANGKLPNYINI